MLVGDLPPCPLPWSLACGLVREPLLWSISSHFEEHHYGMVKPQPQCRVFYKYRLYLLNIVFPSLHRIYSDSIIKPLNFLILISECNWIQAYTSYFICLLANIWWMHLMVDTYINAEILGLVIGNPLNYKHLARQKPWWSIW